MVESRPSQNVHGNAWKPVYRGGQRTLSQGTEGGVRAFSALRVREVTVEKWQRFVRS